MQFSKGGQQGWFHRQQDDEMGIFHTYDTFQPDQSYPPRKIHIYLPVEYEQSDQRYKVIYFNDGNTIFWCGGAYNKTWNMQKVLRDLYIEKKIEKLIIVCIEPLNRDTEYTHDNILFYSKGNVQSYSVYLTQVLKVFIDQNYKTVPDSKYTAIAGASHGGLAAFYICTRYPQSFGIGICLSPSFWVKVDTNIVFSNGNLQIPYLQKLENGKLFKPILNELVNSQEKPKIYIDYGLVRTGGMHNKWIEERATQRSKEAINLLLTLGYTLNSNLFYCEDPLGQHDEESWHRRMYNILPLFYQTN